MPYTANRDTGGFILIDRETTDTAALGLVQAAQAAPKSAAALDAAEPADEAPKAGLLSGIRRLFGG